MEFVGNLLLFTAVKEFCKSIKNWQSYSHVYGGTLFLTHTVDEDGAFLNGQAHYCLLKYTLDLDFAASFSPA